MEERLAEQVDKKLVGGWRKKLFEVIFEADTPAGKLFDVLLIVSILASVAVVMLDSVTSINKQWGAVLKGAEWVFTVLFTIEYVLRLICAGRAIRYARSFFGVVDLLAIVPTYLNLFLSGSRYLLVIRLLRVLRIFRILHLSRFVSEANVLMSALAASKRKILVFFFAVLTVKQQNTRLGGNTHPHLVGYLKTPAPFEYLLAQEHVHQPMQLCSQRLGHLPVHRKVLFYDLYPLVWKGPCPQPSASGISYKPLQYKPAHNQYYNTTQN